ncbi:hypothetical protein DNTS_008411 [Danionella cerebrum]|uniref:Uncharacterized protein n=1 Tax=Danionella cerebrum TaxID=2873325 RepID=A0A553MTR2_9TELE|nr:hypothetical protein DNTS_008411 [Danionella translucida]
MVARWLLWDAVELYCRCVRWPQADSYVSEDLRAAEFYRQKGGVLGSRQDPQRHGFREQQNLVEYDPETVPLLSEIWLRFFPKSISDQRQRREHSGTQELRTHQLKSGGGVVLTRFPLFHEVEDTASLPAFIPSAQAQGFFEWNFFLQSARANSGLENSLVDGASVDLLKLRRGGFRDVVLSSPESPSLAMVVMAASVLPPATLTHPLAPQQCSACGGALVCVAMSSSRVSSLARESAPALHLSFHQSICTLHLVKLLLHKSDGALLQRAPNPEQSRQLSEARQKWRRRGLLWFCCAMREAPCSPHSSSDSEDQTVTGSFTCEVCCDMSISVGGTEQNCRSPSSITARSCSQEELCFVAAEKHGNSAHCPSPAIQTAGEYDTPLSQYSVRDSGQDPEGGAGWDSRSGSTAGGAAPEHLSSVHRAPEISHFP